MSHTFPVIPQRSAGGSSGGVANPMTATLNTNANAIVGASSITSLLGAVCPIVSSPAPSNVNWSGISNESGTSTFWACVNGGYLYTVTSGGVAVQRGTVQNWSGIARISSTSGMACVYGGQIWVTSNTLSTVTVSSASPTANWSGISGYSGLGYVACINGGGIYNTTDNGATWNLTSAPTDSWSSIVLNFGNNRAWAATTSGKVYYSDATLTTWTLVTNIPASLSFTSIDAYLTIGQFWAATTSGKVYKVTSGTGSASWVLLPVPGQYVKFNPGNFANTIAIANPGGLIYTIPADISQTTLSNWVPGTITGNWSCVSYLPAINDIPGIVIAGQNAGGLYISTTPPVAITSHYTLALTSLGTTSINAWAFNLNSARNGSITIGAASGGWSTDVLINTGSAAVTTIGNTSVGGNVTISTRSSSSITLDTGATGVGAGASSNAINLTSKYITAQAYDGTSVRQPLIQYGTATGSGGSGTVSVTIPAAYALSTSYVVQVTMRDAPTAQLYATPTASNAFTIGWTSAGTGTQTIMWTTFGT